MDKLIDLNPWLRQLIEVQRYAVVNPRTKSTLEILSADVASSWGHLAEFIVCDELTVWPRPELWHSLFSASAKRPGCVLVIISNAGLGAGTAWQWTVRETARTLPGWYYHSLDGAQASWISAEALAEQKRLLPPIAYARLWLNLWQTETGDALDVADIEACITLTEPAIFPQRGCAYLGALDLGLKNDHSALVILGLDLERQHVTLTSCESWAPPVAGGQVSLERVKGACIRAQTRFNLLGIVFDPWQAALMAEQLRNEGIPTFEVPFTPRNLDMIATTLLQAFRNCKVDLYRNEQLIRDLCRLTIVQRPNGQFRLQATRDEHGHADRATALAMGLPAAEQFMRELLRPCVEVDEIAVFI